MFMLMDGQHRKSSFHSWSYQSKYLKQDDHPYSIKQVLFENDLILTLEAFLVMGNEITHTETTYITNIVLFMD